MNGIFTLSCYRFDPQAAFNIHPRGLAIQISGSTYFYRTDFPPCSRLDGIGPGSMLSAVNKP